MLCVTSMLCVRWMMTLLFLCNEAETYIYIWGGVRVYVSGLEWGNGSRARRRNVRGASVQLAPCVLRKEWKMPETSQSWATTGPAMVGSVLSELDLPRQKASNERAKQCSLQSAKAEKHLKHSQESHSILSWLARYKALKPLLSERELLKKNS